MLINEEKGGHLKRKRNVGQCLLYGTQEKHCCTVKSILIYFNP